MSLYLASLNSGSNGNCYYVGNQTEAVLVDAGISCREVEKRLARIGLTMEKIKAILISHEHSDHIRGMEVLARKYDLPVYLTTATHRCCPSHLPSHLVKPLFRQQSLFIGDLEIRAFGKQHDAADPCSFIITHQSVTVGVFTDIGKACADVIAHFAACHAAVLESNYDEEMLETGGYPLHLKRRIRGGKGHLSNREALELFCTHRSPALSHLLLGHLSQNNNCPKLVASLFEPHAGATKVVVASRHQESPLFEILATGDLPAPPSFAPPSVAQLQFAFD